MGKTSASTKQAIRQTPRQCLMLMFRQTITLGLLIPRVTYAQRTTNFSTLPAVAQGLTVYQTDAGGDGEGYYYNTSTTTTPPG